MIKTIVVPVDFSETSCRAARYALDELGTQLKADVVLVTVLEPSDLRAAMKAGLHGFETDEDVKRQVQAWVEQQFAKIESASSGGVKTRRDVRRGLPEREIIEAIREHKADLVVMGSTGIARRIPIGSKAEYVLRHGDVAVTLIVGKG
jgi:nucleotide-binding universal stress UspA family protein